MNKEEAKKIISKELEIYRNMAYEELIKLLDTPICFERKGPSGSIYQIEIQVFWDKQKNSNIRVIGSIDDGGFRAFCPVNDGFIKTSTGNFIDE